MSATSDEVRTSCHYEEVYYETKSYRRKPSPRGWPDTRYDGDSARTRTSLAGICGPSGLPRNLAVMMAGSRSQDDSYSKINSPADSGDDEGILSWGIISFPLPPTIPSYHGKALENRSATKKFFLRQQTIVDLDNKLNDAVPPIRRSPVAQHSRPRAFRIRLTISPLNVGNPRLFAAIARMLPVRFLP